MLQTNQVSAKRILKATLTALIALCLVFAATVWAFGDKEIIETEIVKVPSFSTVESLNSVKSPTDGNLTQEISKALAKDLVDKNPDGPLQTESGAQIAAIDPDQLVATTLQKAIEEFDASALRGKVDEGQIVFTSTSDKEAQADYFEEMNSLIKKNLKGLSINYEKPEATNFPVFVSTYEKIIADLYALPVPRVISGFHANLIELFLTQRNIYALLANYQTDPLQALLALDFADSVDDEFITLSNQMNKYIEDNGITF
ncbi:MAG: hypothetical protein R3B52_01455 [Candidatus Paceibacterota bacterium]